MRDYRVTVPANAEATLNVAGTVIRCIDGTAPFRIRVDGGDTLYFERGLGYAPKAPFQRVTIINEAAAPLHVTLFLGSGGLDDSRLTLAATGLNSRSIRDDSPSIFESVPDVVCAAGTRTLVASALADRAEILIVNTTLSTVRIGDNTCAANDGLVLGANATLCLRTSGAVHCWNPTGAAVSLAVAITRWGV